MSDDNKDGDGPGDETDTGRPQGLLTQTHRQFLLSDDPMGSYTRQQRFRRRDAIRERVTNGMLDFRLLNSRLPDNEIGKIFYQDNDLAPETSIKPALAFFMRVEDENDIPLYPDLPRQPVFDEFIGTLERAVRSFLAAEKGMIADVEVSIDVGNIRPPEDVLAELESDDEADEPIGPETLATLESAGVDPEKLAELQRGTDSDGSEE